MRSVFLKRFSVSKYCRKYMMAGKGSPTEKVLYINCSGKDEKSFTNLASKSFFKNYSKLHPSHLIEEIDLWDKNLLQFDLNRAASKMRMDEGNELPQDKEAFSPVVKMIDDLFSVSKLVISSPVWNHSMPYVLKQYIDCIVQPGLTVHDELTVEESYGLVTGRPLLLITSSAWDYSQEPTSKLDHMHPYLKDVFGLIGFTDIKQIYIKNTCVEPREKLLEFIEQSALMKAETF